MKMPVLLKVFVHIICVVSLSSCSLIDNFKKESAAEKKVEEFLVFLDEGDVDSIKEMLCKETLSLPDIDEQITGAIDFFQGKVISQGHATAGSGGESINYGEIIRLNFAPYILDIETDADKIYRVDIHYYFIYKDNDDKVGITNFSIRELVDGSYHNHDRVFKLEF